MFRSLFITFRAPSRTASLRSTRTISICPSRIFQYPSATSYAHSRPCSLLQPRAQIAVFSTSVRFFLDPKLQSESKKQQPAARNKKLKADPENVTTTSSVRPIFEPSSTSSADEPDMLRDIKSDLQMVKDTFALKDVPKEVYWFGIGGVVPYVATSMTTLALAWDTNYARQHGVAYLLDKGTVEYLLQTLEPIQVGLGAVILSFLGAVHWGLEFARYGGSHPYRRYTIGILAPVLAWPTIALPFDYALLTQFVGLTGMYFADAQATTWGWAPRWYTTYRFILTFLVGASIVLTLIGRGQIGDASTPSARQAQSHYQEIKDTQKENRDRELREMAIEANRRRNGEKKSGEKGKNGERGKSPSPAKPTKAEEAQGAPSGEMREENPESKSKGGQLTEPKGERDVAEPGTES